MGRLHDLAPFVAIVAATVAVFLLLLQYLNSLVTALQWTLTFVSLSTVFAVLENIDRAHRFLAWIQRGFSWLGGRIERGAVANRIRGAIGEASSLINNEGGPLLPHGLKIEWVRPDKLVRDAFVQENNVIVVLDHHRNDGRNLARTVSLYVSEGLIPTSRVYVDPLVMNSADLIIGRKILLLSNRMDAVKYFNEEFVQPATTNPTVQRNLTAMENLDYDGTFTRILMREFSELWTALFPSPPTNEIQKDTIRFLELLDRLSNKEIWEMVPLMLRGKGINVAVLPVARSELAGSNDIEPHLKRVETHYLEEVEKIYVVSRGVTNLRMSQTLMKEIQRKKLYALENSSEYSIRIEGGKKLVAFVCLLRRIKRSELFNSTSSLGQEAPAIAKVTQVPVPSVSRQKTDLNERVEQIPNLASPRTDTMKGRELLAKAAKLCANTEGIVNGAELGSTLRNLDPYFAFRTYEVSRLSDFIAKYPGILVSTGKRRPGADFYRLV